MKSRSWNGGSARCRRELDRTWCGIPGTCCRAARIRGLLQHPPAHRAGRGSGRTATAEGQPESGSVRVRGATCAGAGFTNSQWWRGFRRTHRSPWASDPPLPRPVGPLRLRRPSRHPAWRPASGLIRTQSRATQETARHQRGAVARQVKIVGAGTKGSVRIVRRLQGSEVFSKGDAGKLFEGSEWADSSRGPIPLAHAPRGGRDRYRIYERRRDGRGRGRAAVVCGGPTGIDIGKQVVSVTNPGESDTSRGVAGSRTTREFRNPSGHAKLAGRWGDGCADVASGSGTGMGATATTGRPVYSCLEREGIRCMLFTGVGSSRRCPGRPQDPTGGLSLAGQVINEQGVVGAASCTEDIPPAQQPQHYSRVTRPRLRREGTGARSVEDEQPKLVGGGLRRQRISNGRLRTGTRLRALIARRAQPRSPSRRMARTRMRGRYTRCGRP